MISIIPDFKIMDAIIIPQMEYPGTKEKRTAFTKAIELISLSNTKILISSFIFDRMKPRLNESHNRFFEDVCSLDYSTQGQKGYNVYNCIDWLAKIEATSRYVIILSSQELIDNYNALKTDRIKVMNPVSFNEKIDKAEKLFRRGTFQSLSDAIIAVFFFNH